MAVLLTSKGRPLAGLLALLLIESALLSCRAQSVDPVDIGIDSSIIHKWWFWVIIAVIVAFFIVAAFFVWRGFRNYRRYKKELDELQNQADAVSSEENLSQMSPPSGKAKDVELGFADGRSDSRTTGTDVLSLTLDDSDLARRTGSKKPSGLTPSQTARF